MTDADDRRAGKALQGLEFPANKGQILAYAAERGADAKTLRALRALPQGQFSDNDAVQRAVPQRPEQHHAP